QFARTLATLLINGVPVLTALKITEAIVPNVILKEAIAKTREAVTDGKTIAQPLARTGLFPQLMLDLLKIGEDTGDVPGSLQNIADTYENELTTQLRVLTNLIEPAMIICMAIGVGGLLFSILSAMFAITSSLNRRSYGILDFGFWILDFKTSGLRPVAARSGRGPARMLRPGTGRCPNPTIQ